MVSLTSTFCCYVAAVVSDSVWPHRGQPTRLPRPWDSPGKNTGVGCHVLLQCLKVKRKVKLPSRVRLFATQWTVAYKAPPSLGFSRQKCWSELPLPSPVAWARSSQIHFFFSLFRKHSNRSGLHSKFTETPRCSLGMSSPLASLKLVWG